MLSHGTPSSIDEVEAFYTRIRRGRPPSHDQLAELVGRYASIGGVSPLTERTRAQVDGLREVLERRAPGQFHVDGGTKYATPTIESACEDLVDVGVRSVIGLVLTPLDAAIATDQYHDRASTALAGRADYRPIRSWWQTTRFTSLLATLVTDAVAASGVPDPLVLFTAHSLPVRADANGVYARALSAAAAAVAASAQVTHHRVCWQSAGRTDDEWLGPDLLDVLRGLDASASPHVVVCPIGFVSDHLEVLYDIDLEAAAVARSSGLSLSRTASLNDDDRFLEVLGDAVQGVAA